MSAAAPRGGSARVEDRDPFCRGHAGQFQFLERAGWRSGNILPVQNGTRRDTTRHAQPSIRRVVLALQSEQLQGEFVELRLGVVVGGDRPGETLRHELAQASVEVAKSRDRRGAVLSHSNPGWFSATAKEEIVRSSNARAQACCGGVLRRHFSQNSKSRPSQSFLSF